MPRLKSRQKFIPNGFQFYIPQLKWSPPPYSSFEVICRSVEALIAANPTLAAQHKWPTNILGIADWVDTYNATLCLRMGWTDYVEPDAGPSAPKSLAPHQQESLRNLAVAAARARELVAGAKTLTEWIDSGEPPVAEELSTHRAIVCSKCPKNEPGDWTKWFTVPASELIKRQVEKASARKLTTPRDDQLNLCTACHCPLKLKVHVPIGWIAKRLTEPQKAGLREGKDCWIISELGG